MPNVHSLTIPLASMELIVHNSYQTKGHFLAGICVLKRTCKDNDDIVSSCINDPLGCKNIIKL